MFVHLYLRTSIHTYIYVYLNIYIYTFVWMNTHTYLYIYTLCPTALSWHDSFLHVTLHIHMRATIRTHSNLWHEISICVPRLIISVIYEHNSFMCVSDFLTYIYMLCVQHIMKLQNSVFTTRAFRARASWDSFWRLARFWEWVYMLYDICVCINEWIYT